MSLALDRVFSCRAECIADVQRFTAACEANGAGLHHFKVVPDPDGMPDMEIEFRSSMPLVRLKRIAAPLEDGHVLFETLRECPLAEN